MSNSHFQHPQQELENLLGNANNPGFKKWTWLHFLKLVLSYHGYNNERVVSVVGGGGGVLKQSLTVPCSVSMFFASLCYEQCVLLNYIPSPNLYSSDPLLDKPYFKHAYPSLLSLRASSLRLGKGRRAWNYVSGIWVPPPVLLWLPVDWAVRFPPISAKQKWARM